MSSVSYKANVEWHTPGNAPGGTIGGVEEDEDREALAALEADPVREPLAEGGGEIEAISAPRTVTYQNDAINRLSMNDPNIGTPTIFTPNHLNQYTSVTGHGPLNYDGNLNVSGYDGWTFVHDAEKRLLSVTGNGHTALFVYDGLGRCVKRTIDGATVVLTYDNWKPIVEWEWYAGAPRLVAWNLYGPGADEILVRNQPNTGGYLYYHLDPMGNVQFLLSDTQHGLEKYTYDVFGKPTIIGWANGDVRPISQYGNRFLFTGREYLYTFGLYDYRHRTYHPGLGRFLQTDPTGLQIEGAKLSAQQKTLYRAGGAPEKFSSSELNLYRYCQNNPVNNSDPDGLTIVPGKDLADAWKKSKPELMKDPVMSKIINRLEKKDVIVNLVKTKSDISGATFDQGFTVNWNPDAAQRSVADGTRLSPAMVLGHELDHIHEGFTNPSAYMTNYKTPDSQYTRAEERRVITRGAEASMLKTFYNEKPRSDYDIVTYGVKSPLDR